MSVLVDVALSQATNTLRLPIDASTLGISPLQAKIFHDFYGLRRIKISTRLLLNALQSIVATLLNNNPGIAKKIKYVIYAHTSLTHAPFSYKLLPRLLALYQLDNAISFGFNLNKCAAGVEALQFIQTCFATDSGAEAILLLTGDIAFTSQQRILPGAAIAGDVCAGAIFQTNSCTDAGATLRCVYKKTFPEFYQGAWLSRPASTTFEVQFPQILAEHIILLVQQGGLALANIKWILPHNVNIPVWQRIAALLAYDINKIYLSNITEFGHCFTADFLINYNAIRTSLSAGDYFIVVGIGYGLTIATAIFQQL
jgi:3-oxoacyl-[acyl-carrier-protein] synthase-3